MKQETTGWQWHQMDHMQMQIACILFQRDNHASSLNFLQAGCYCLLFLTPNQQCQSTEGWLLEQMEEENKGKLVNLGSPGKQALKMKYSTLSNTTGKMRCSKHHHHVLSKGPLPGEPGLADSPSVFFYLFLKRTFRGKRHRSLYAWCPSSHPNISVKALKHWPHYRISLSGLVHS